MKKFVLWSGLTLGGLLVSVAQAEVIDAGKLYREACAICHGDAGDGKTATQSGLRPSPRDFTSTEAAMELTRERMIFAVTHGRRGTAMMSHEGRFTPAEIEAVVDYVRETFMRTPTEKTPDEPPQLSLGEAIYAQHCAVCHGDKGSTAYWARNGLNPPPRDFTGDEAKSILTRQRMITSVTHGRPGSGMQSFKSRLSSEEIEAAVIYIRHEFMGIAPNQDTGHVPRMQQNGSAPVATGSAVVENRHESAPPENPVENVNSDSAEPQTGQHSPHAGGMPAMGAGVSPGHAEANDMTLPLPKGLTGDPVKGRDFFMKNCFTCHGIKGGGNGPRAYFNIPRPRDFTSPESRQALNRPRIFDSIAEGRRGTVMPAWSKVLDDQQIADITEFVFRAFIEDVKAGGVEEAAATEGMQQTEEIKKKAD
ncbi:MAG: c-type cytochrome [Gammaproteobacteria bacterium]|nr:c-type cytochrome [Gammaproteobacteria bacterium]MCF6363851.1 c-type cytochrome [Gammaproteobacteria bacterium]